MIAPVARAVPERRPWVTLILAAVAIAVALAVAGRWGSHYVPQFAAWVRALGPWAPVLFIGGYVVACLLAIPGSVLTLAGGAIFGLWAGVAYVFIGAAMGSSAAFLVSRYVLRSAVEARVRSYPRLQSVNRAIERDGRKIVFLLRLSPLFPFALLNYALGVSPVRFADYVLASVGMIPGTMLYVYYGKIAGDVAAVAAGGTSARGPGSYALLVLGLLATIAVTAVIARSARRALQQRSLDDERPQGTGVETTAVRMPSVPYVTPLNDGENDARLLQQVRPAAWKNPVPTGRYHLIVIGAGTGGLVTAAAAAGLGARVALVERHLMGGDCLNTGCVPSKSILRAARSWSEARAARQAFGGPEAEGPGDFAMAFERMRRIRADLSPVDSAERFRSLGVDVFLGDGRFVSRNAIEVNGQRLQFRRAVVATGARAAVPSIEGLAGTPFYTNETIFSLREPPDHLMVLGGGAIGCELAQAFARFGVKVTMLVRDGRLLPRDTADASQAVHAALLHDGVTVLLGATVAHVSRTDENTALHVTTGAGERTIRGDALLVAVGRDPNTEGLGLEAASVKYDAEGGVLVNDRLQTSNDAIYAVGDVCSALKLTHAADFQARLVVQNALFFGRGKASALVTPWVTYTDPESAQVGLTEEAAARANVLVDVVNVPMHDVDRARLDGAEAGFCRILLARGGDRIVGASIVGAHAGEHISAITLAMTNKLGLSAFGRTMHPYPTHGEVLRRAADTWRRRKLTPTVRALFARYFRFIE